MSTTNLSAMKAWLFSSTAGGGMEKNMSLDASATPPPSKALGSGQSLVEVLAMALNPVDYKFAEIPLVGRMVVGRPASPGLDYCGRIVSTSTSLKPGTVVFGRLDSPTKFGTLAQYTITPQAGTVVLPKGVTPEDAAAIGTAGLTAYQSIAPNVKAGSGEKIFLNGGSGGTGTWAIQVAKTLGCHVTTSCSTPNVALCKELGADEVIDYKSVDVTKKLKEGGEQFTLVVDYVGSPSDLYSECHHFVKPEGKFVQVGAGMSMGEVGGLMSRMMLPGMLGGGKRPFQFVGVQNNYEEFEKLGQWMVDGKIKAVVDETFEMKDALKAYEKLRTGRAKGKIVVKVAE